jgi:hypothetical protein
LESDEEEVEDLHAKGHIREILHATYERKTKGQGSDAEKGSPFRIRTSVEPTTPCVTKISEDKEPVNQQVISSRRIFTGLVFNGNSSRSISSTRSS